MTSKLADLVHTEYDKLGGRVYNRLYRGADDPSLLADLKKATKELTEDTNRLRAELVEARSRQKHSDRKKKA